MEIYCIVLGDSRGWVLYGANFLLYNSSFFFLVQGQIFSYIFWVSSSKWTLAETMVWIHIGKSLDHQSNQFLCLSTSHAAQFNF